MKIRAVNWGIKFTPVKISTFYNINFLVPKISLWKILFFTQNFVNFKDFILNLYDLSQFLYFGTQNKVNMGYTRKKFLPV